MKNLTEDFIKQTQEALSLALVQAQLNRCESLVGVKRWVALECVDPTPRAMGYTGTTEAVL